jgi:hypothetical protein
VPCRNRILLTKRDSLLNETSASDEDVLVKFDQTARNNFNWQMENEKLLAGNGDDAEQTEITSSRRVKNFYKRSNCFRWEN